MGVFGGDRPRVIVEASWAIPLLLEFIIDAVKLYYSLKRLVEWLHIIFRHIEGR